MSERDGALAGIRVISFGAFVAGNTAAKLLAELGADVVKVEPRGRPEVLRTPAYAIGDAVTEPSGVPNTVMFATLSRGTRNLSIDLDQPAARPILHRLVGRADIVIENFGGMTLSRWGCSFEDLLADNPGLVMLSLSGYGRNGPRSGYLGYASTISSYIGLSSAWGYTHGTLTDYVTAATGAVAAVAAVGHARRTGEPVYLDIAQIDAMAPIMAELFARPLNLHSEEPVPLNRVPGSWLSGIFPGIGYDAWLAVDIEDGWDWAVLCRLLEREELVTADRQEADRREPELRECLARWAADFTPFTGMHILQKAGLAAAVVQTSEDIWRDPQLHVRQFAEVVEQADLGTVTYPRSAQRWTGSPGKLSVGPARLGQHTNEVLREWIGLTEKDLKSLSSEGAIFDAG